MKQRPVLVVLGILLPFALTAAPSVARLPLSFEPDRDHFGAEAAGGRLELTANSVSGRVSLRLEGARHPGRIEGVQRLASQSHYLLGNDPAQWRRHVPNYARVRVRDAWPGIDVVYYGTRNALEFDFVVSAGADPSRIQFVTEGGHLRDPVIYQQTPGGRRLVTGRYTRRGSHVAFRLAAYDRRRPLVIDPVIEYATALGGGAADTGVSIAVDDSGAAYVLGTAYSGNFPVTHALQSQSTPGRHLFVAKLAPGGGTLEYSTYLGGTIAEFASGIAVDGAGSAYLTGSTNSPDFPIAGPAPLQKTILPNFGSNGFAARLSADGSALVYSTFLGAGAGNGPRLAVDRSGNAYLAGTASPMNFPLVKAMSVPPPFGASMYMVKLRPDGTAVYSTFLAGQGVSPAGIAADMNGAAYITGMTGFGATPSFPLVNPLQSTPRSPNSPFVAKVKADGSALVYSTYLGGSENDQATGIAVDAAGNAYITGMTNSGDFPTVNAWQPRLAGAAMYKSTDGGVTSSRSDANLAGGATNVAADTRNPATLYATVSGSYGQTWLYRTTDAGGSWRYLTNVTTFALDPTTSGTLYAGAGRSVMKSTDAGATWTKLYDGPASEVRALAVDPLKPMTIYAGYGGGADTDGVYETVDGGATWMPVYVGSMHGVRFLAINPMDSTVYVMTGMGFTSSPQRLQRSSDGGQTWSAVSNLSNVFPYGMAFDPSNPATFYVFESGVFFKTTDGGQTFTTHSLSANFNYPGSMAIDPANPNTLYVATSRGVYKSIDGGQNWNATAIIGGVNAVAVDASSNVYACEGIQPDAFVAKLNPQGTALVYSTFLGGSAADSATAIAVDGSGSVYVAGSTSSADFPVKNPSQPLSAGNQFLAKFDPSGSSLIYATPLNSTVISLAVDSSGAVYLTGQTSQTDFPTKNPVQTFTTGTFFQSSDGGRTWTSTTSGDAFTASIQHLGLNAQNPSQVFAQTQTNIYRSMDGGASFSKLFLHPPPPLPNILSLALDPRTPTTLYAGTGSGSDFGVYQSTDNGQSWSDLGSLSMVNALAVSPASSSVLFAATDYGLMMSTDGGAGWAQSGSFYNVYTVIFDSQNPQTLYASTAFDGVFKSVDGGANWTAINTGFPNAGGPAAKCLAVDPSNHSVIYAAGRDGIFRSANSGANWTAIDGGLRVRQGYWVSAFAVDSTTPSTLYAGLDSGGLYKSTDGGATWNVTALSLPTISDIAVDPHNSNHILAAAYFNPYDAFVMKIGE